YRVYYNIYRIDMYKDLNTKCWTCYYSVRRWFETFPVFIVLYGAASAAYVAKFCGFRQAAFALAIVLVLLIFITQNWDPGLVDLSRTKWVKGYCWMTILVYVVGFFLAIETIWAPRKPWLAGTAVLCLLLLTPFIPHQIYYLLYYEKHIEIPEG